MKAIKIKLTLLEYQEIRAMRFALFTEPINGAGFRGYYFYDHKKKRVCATNGHILRFANLVDLGKKSFSFHPEEFNALITKKTILVPMEILQAKDYIKYPDIDKVLPDTEGDLNSVRLVSETLNKFLKTFPKIKGERVLVYKFSKKKNGGITVFDKSKKIVGLIMQAREI